MTRLSGTGGADRFRWDRAAPGGTGWCRAERRAGDGARKTKARYSSFPAPDSALVSDRFRFSAAFS
ncbi:primase-helicase zinc-binding domain-containing protein [Streptomyces sp. NPDC046203]|uniref:primase-helicase zinc-binding domain-containing protein n=1 Tax=Streptomyces sp. NPDC046203 TaxID=3154602 RepID=UPI0033D37903